MILFNEFKYSTKMCIQYYFIIHQDFSIKSQDLFPLWSCNQARRQAREGDDVYMLLTISYFMVIHLKNYLKRKQIQKTDQSLKQSWIRCSSIITYSASIFSAVFFKQIKFRLGFYSHPVERNVLLPVIHNQLLTLWSSLPSDILTVSKYSPLTNKAESSAYKNIGHEQAASMSFIYIKNNKGPIMFL